MVTSKTSQQRKGSGRGTRVVRVPSLSRRSSDQWDANRETERQQSHLNLQTQAQVSRNYQSIVIRDSVADQKWVRIYSEK